MIRFYFVFAILLSTAVSVAWADEMFKPEKLKDIQQLMEINGASRISQQYSQAVISQMTLALKQSRPDISEKALQVMQKAVMEIIKQKVEAKDGLLVQVAELYHKYFTHQEIKGLLDFYNSDLGKKAVKTMPLLASESIRMGQQWGKTIGPEVEKHVRDALAKEGIDLNKK